MIENIMVDIETMGVAGDVPILSIGAVTMSPQGIGVKFYRTISLESCMNRGFLPEAQTIMFWMQQSDESRDELINASCKLSDVLHHFKGWVENIGKASEFVVWSNGANFDGPIIRNAYNKLKMSPPWEYYQERCYRTMVKAYSTFKKPFPKDKIQHNALADAEYQAEILINIFNNYYLWEKE